MRHVEEAGVGARVSVSVDDALLVLDGHVPAAEGHHTTAQSHVIRMEGGALEGRRIGR